MSGARFPGGILLSLVPAPSGAGTRADDASAIAAAPDAAACRGRPERRFDVPRERTPR